MDTVHRVFAANHYRKNWRVSIPLLFSTKRKPSRAFRLSSKGSAGRSFVAQQIKRCIAHAHAPGISITVSNGEDPAAFPMWFTGMDALNASGSMADCSPLPAGLREEASCSTAKWGGAVREEVRQLS